MEESKSGTTPPALLLFHDRAWFRAYVQCDQLPTFPVTEIDAVPVDHMETWYYRLLIGRGPVSQTLPMTGETFFEQGKSPYPTFECPGVGPKGAGAFISGIPRKLEIDELSALFQIEVGYVTETGDPEWLSRHEAELLASSYPETGGPVSGDSAAFVGRTMRQASHQLEMLIGAYALYQYPLVWQCVGRSHSVAHIDRQTGKGTSKSFMDVGTFVPFRLLVGERATNGRLCDAVAANAASIAQTDLHTPFLLLQRALWERDVSVRFITQFWILEHLARKGTPQAANHGRLKELTQALEGFVAKDFPDMLGVFKARKGKLIEPTLLECVRTYVIEVGAPYDEEGLKTAARVRNHLSHGRPVIAEDLRRAEMLTRRLTRYLLRKELERAGVFLAESQSVIPDAGCSQLTHLT